MVMVANGITGCTNREEEVVNPDANGIIGHRNLPRKAENQEEEEEQVVNPEFCG